MRAYHTRRFMSAKAALITELQCSLTLEWTKLFKRLPAVIK